MTFLEGFRDAKLAKSLLEQIKRRSIRKIRLMEFCGGHTVAIFRHGIRQLLPPTIEMLSGPGCPVCVTASADLDKAMAFARLPGVILTTFGDMLRVPGSYASLQQVRAEGGDIRTVYSTQDALAIARNYPAKSVIFLGIGFETTAPTIAASILQAKQEGIKNYYVHCLHKVCPPVIKAILEAGEVRLDGIMAPGHVSAIIGSRPYEFIPRDYRIACAVSGFEPLDILLCVERLVEQIENGKPQVEIAYRRGVKEEGNPKALEVMSQVFEPSDANWRGIGVVPASGLVIKKRYRRFDAEQVFPVKVPPPREPKGCRCGEILRGVKTPLDCPLFRKACDPEHPVGPCMVSSEGSCAAYYHYGEGDGG